MKISVLIVTYNGSLYIEQQLVSIINQTYKVDEIIIVDDSSTDNTIPLVKSVLGKIDISFKLIVNSKNLGTRFNFEQGFSYAKGDLVLFSDQDDIWDINKCFEIVKYFSENKSIDAVFTDGYIMVNDVVSERTLWGDILFTFEVQNSLNSFNLFEFLIFRENVATGATMAFRTSALVAAKPFIYYNNIWHDYWLALYFASNNKLGFIAQKLINYRIHNNQQVGVLQHEKQSFISLRQRSWLFEFNNDNYIELFNFYKYLFKFTYGFYGQTNNIHDAFSKRLLASNHQIHERLIYLKYHSNNQLIKSLKMVKHFFFNKNIPVIHISDLIKHIIFKWRHVQF